MIRMRRMMVVGMVAMMAAAIPAQAQSQMPRYEPSQRLRLALEAGCLKDEVAREAWCVKKCQADFRLDLSARTAVCIGTKADARYEPPKPEFRPPSGPPTTPRPPGA